MDKEVNSVIKEIKECLMDKEVNSDLDMTNPVHVHLAFSRGKIKREDYDLFRKNLKKRG